MARVHITLDERSDVERWYACRSGGLAVLALPMVTYQDAVTASPAELADAFFSAAGTALDRSADLALEDARSRLVDAGRRALGRTGGVAEGAAWGLIFTVFQDAGARRWRVFNIGANVVLKVSAARFHPVTLPNAPLWEQDLAGLSIEDRVALGGISTAILGPQPDTDAAVRAAQVTLEPGDWLVAAPGSAHVAELTVGQQPESLGEVGRDVISRLASGNNRYAHSWLAVQATSSDVEEREITYQGTGLV